MAQFLAQPSEVVQPLLEQNSGSEHFPQFQPQKKSSSQLQDINSINIPILSHYIMIKVEYEKLFSAVFFRCGVTKKKEREYEKK